MKKNHNLYPFPALRGDMMRTAIVEAIASASSMKQRYIAIQGSNAYPKGIRVYAETTMLQIPCQPENDRELIHALPDGSFKYCRQSMDGIA